MATYDATVGSVGVPYIGTVGRFFVLENPSVDLDSIGVANGDVVKVLNVPAGCVILGVEVEIVTASDAATSATCDVGDGADTDFYLASGDLKSTAGTVLSSTNTTGRRYTADDTIDLTLAYSGATTVYGKVKVRAYGVKVA